MRQILFVSTMLVLCSIGVSAQPPTHEQVYNNTVQIENNKQSIVYISKQNTANKTEIKKLNDKIDNVSTQLSKSTSTSIALSSLEYPAYNKDKKLSIAMGTGTYNGETSIAYGVAYRPNYDVIFSVKGTDDSVTTSVGVNL